MKINRTNEGNIIVLNGETEIHPYLSILAAIELQQNSIPPRVIELTYQGWSVVVEALKEAVDNLPETGEDKQQLSDSVSLQEEKEEASSYVPVTTISVEDKTVPEKPLVRKNLKTSK